MGGGEQNKRSYIPGGQALMMGLKKSHTWWYGAAISGAPNVFVAGNFDRTEEGELGGCVCVCARCPAAGPLLSQPCACTLMGIGVFWGAGELSGLCAH